MAKKRNVVKKAKGNLNLTLIVILVLGWIMAAATLLGAEDAGQEQEAMVIQARTFLADKLYVRAVKQYKAALSNYHTENDSVYEKELLSVYREAGMTTEYYGLIDERIENGRADAEEYEERARAYLERGSDARAMEVLQNGMKACPNDSLVSLYEEVSYKYSPVTTAYSDLKMPAKDWYIPAFDGQHWGYILANGRTALNFQYEEATCFAGSYAVVKLNGVYTLIDKDGYWNAVDKNGLDEVVSICGSRVAAIKDGQYGIYTNTFNRLGNETYEDVILNDNGMVAVKKDGKWFLLDSELEPVTDTQFLEVVPNSRGQLFASGYAVVADEEGYFLIDEWGNACFGTRFADAKGLEGGLFAVADASGKWGFSNENGELVVDCQYEDACSFSDRLAAVQYGGDWGYINKYNTMVIEPQFTKAYPFLNGTALAVDELGNYRILTLKYYEMF